MLEVWLHNVNQVQKDTPSQLVGQHMRACPRKDIILSGKAGVRIHSLDSRLRLGPDSRRDS